ncbi:UDP-glucose 4-epimerase [Sarcoptes scabiei]|uniref:UDP-glucose 4-epimerase n=1 Tax=Sarcoptes scabiei TaxID=52283 RepID=A0A132AEV0_SARSC|nr:UDP-glucose 4-epimerase [Sarcoptes scabiei]KPM08950.1 UDP-glucose 4-epimerase-like protein 1 [Sarcoptes scabiei]
MVKILLTGGSGYVGSHCLIDLLSLSSLRTTIVEDDGNQGDRDESIELIVIDNLINSIQLANETLPESIKRCEQLTGKRIKQFYHGDINDRALLETIFQEHRIDCVIHFAALKSVAQSISQPLVYYRNNVSGTIQLLETMQRYGCKRFIFSSSATVYGRPLYLPLDEKHPIGVDCSNPYGRSKSMIEMILKDLCHSDEEWSIIALRYFNPVGAHQSGLIGEDPNDIPNNLMPYITQVAAKVRTHLNVFGNDYNTDDGTGVRDYIHIDDLASGHRKALQKMFQKPEEWLGFHPLNLGTGRGISVLQMIDSFERVNNLKIPYEIAERRSGDLDVVYADASLAKKLLDWEANGSVDEMCRSAWNWQSKNPNGYRSQS